MIISDPTPITLVISTENFIAGLSRAERCRTVGIVAHGEHSAISKTPCIIRIVNAYYVSEFCFNLATV